MIEIIEEVTKNKLLKPMSTLDQCKEYLVEIAEGLQAVDTMIVAIAKELAQLEKDGVFESEPTESWEARNGNEAKYLRLVFPTEGGKRRRMYVGASEVKIQAARDKIVRTRHFRTRKTERGYLQRRMQRAMDSLMSVNMNVNSKIAWPAGRTW